VPNTLAETGDFPVNPVANQGKKWRLAYYEGGPYFEYRDVLFATLRGLMKFGWIETVTLPKPTGEETDELWRFLSEKVKSDYIEFVPDAHYSSNWDEDGDREQVAGTLIKRLNEIGDIDLVIAMGTWAGKDLANAKHHTPTVVFAASDPVAAGIIESAEDSGLDHIHAAFDPGVYDRQIRIFHEMTKFNKLGLAYENSADGRSYAAVDVIESAGQDLGFDIVPCYTLSDIPDLDAAGNSVINCFEKLAAEVDAIYVTMQGGVRTESIPRLVETANEYRIPTFSQAGSEEVKYGFLASISQGNFRFVGEFNARTISKILNGAQARQLEQRFEPPPKIAINLKTAEIIDYNPPIILLGAADEIYNEITNPGQ
jgi:ABC-type uncharacterized transport system substrate-binding protein